MNTPDKRENATRVQAGLGALALAVAPITAMLDRTYPETGWAAFLWPGALVWVAAFGAALGYAVGLIFREAHTGALCGCIIAAVFWPIAFVIYGALSGLL